MGEGESVWLWVDGWGVSHGGGGGIVTILSFYNALDIEPAASLSPHNPFQTNRAVQTLYEGSKALFLGVGKV